MPTITGQQPDYRQHLEVETPEHVVLDLEIAGIGSRALAALIDALIIGAALFGLSLLLLILAALGVTLGSMADAVLALGMFTGLYGYFTLFEGLRAGQTPGKRLVGIRVVRDTGHGVTFGAAAVRNLLRIADFLPPPYLSGTLLVALHPRGKRLGDLVAGTIVVRDRPVDRRAQRRTQTGVSEAPLAVPELADDEFRLLDQYEARAAGLAPEVRARLAAGLAERFGPRFPVRPADDEDFLKELHGAELARREGGVAVRGAGSLGQRFAARKRPRWDEFQRLAERAARRGLDSFAPDELPGFAARYREVAADLARARTYRAPASVIGQLERLVAAGHNVLYRDERHTGRRIWTLLARECPAAVIQARWYVGLAFLAFALPAVAGYAVLRERPALAVELLPEVMLRRAEAGVERAREGGRYVTLPLEDRPALASRLITNNVRVAFTCFAGGVFIGIGSLVLLSFNGFAIGASAGHFANAGLLGYLLEFVIGHGVLELFAIWVAGAAGFILGRSVVAPGDLTRADALVMSGRLAIRMIGATVVLLVFAGLIEGFLSASGRDLATRLAVSGVSLLFLVLYLVNGARYALQGGGPTT